MDFYFSGAQIRPNQTFNPSGLDAMLATVTAVVISQDNVSVSPTSLENTSTHPTWPPDSNVSKPHRCLQVLYEDIGDSR